MEQKLERKKTKKQEGAETKMKQQEKDRRAHREAFLACGENADITV